MRLVLTRLLPGTDLKKGILDLCEYEHLQTAIVISAVGSLTESVLRTADGKTLFAKIGPFELTSLSGTISHGKAHLHCSLYDRDMITIGGHVMEGCLVHTTMEVCLLGLDEEVSTERLFDPSTGYDELLVHPKK